ncbi:unnamed protein product [Phytophthora fragariaefolia]|uniref:Unnamed protein product n=1 Tax=Phytophthora fragariaefolia TaxID=1490495 RepID=A0A9W6XQQ6_9STRA|nr:unnamed protein product [Phytophthora fragariaefolia]
MTVYYVTRRRGAQVCKLHCLCSRYQRVAVNNFYTKTKFPASIPVLRTPFTFDNDKDLVQLARQYSDAGARVAWQDVANKMQRTVHTALVLRQGLHTLMRTWGRDLTRSPPPSFFAQVRRPRGCRLAVTRRLRGAAPAATTASSPRPVSAATPTPPAPAASFSPSAPVSRPARSIPTTSPVGTTPTPSPTGITPAETSPRPAAVASSSLSSAPAAKCSLCPSLAAKNPNDVFMSGQEAAGDSARVETILREIGSIDERDVLLDIGAGLGNIVVHVALATTVQRAIDIELREGVYQLGLQMIRENVHGRRLRSRILMICGDVAEAKLSRCLPYEQATTVYWNNVLFEPHVISIVKEHLSYMSEIRFFVSTVQM